MPHHLLRRTAALLGLGGLLLAGCKDRTKRPELPPLDQAFSQLVLPPQAKLIARSGSADAIQLSFRSSADRGFLANYYRDALTRQPWTLVSDTEDSTGAVVLYAEEPAGPPMWVRIAPDPEGLGTLVDLAGAVIKKDSTARADSARRAAPPVPGDTGSKAR